MAASKGNTEKSAIEYHQFIWGDLIYGTKEELQSLGIGNDIAFPGEPSGPKRQVHVLDPRGFPTRVERGRAGRYAACIHFPWRERQQLAPWTAFAPGVKKRAHCWEDEYIGAAASLAAAGLLRLDQLPGQPGMRKIRVTVFPDGSVATGAPTSAAYHKEKTMPGAKEIERASKSTYIVRVRIAEDVAMRRLEAAKRADLEYESRMRALPRPAPLMPLDSIAEVSDDSTASRKSLPEIVRSLPQFVPGSMSEGEKHHLRILRGLDERTRDHLLDLAEMILSKRLTTSFGERSAGGPEALTAPASRHLRLVVDNEQQPQG